MWVRRLMIGAGCAVAITFLIVRSNVAADATLQPNGADVTLDTSRLVGTWINVDPNTRGLTKIIITAGKHTSLTIHPFGACTPTDCNWGKEDGPAYGKDIHSTEAKGFTAVFEDNISIDTLCGWRHGDELLVRDFTKYVDNSDRADSMSSERFQLQQ